MVRSNDEHSLQSLGSVFQESGTPGVVLKTSPRHVDTPINRGKLSKTKPTLLVTGALARARLSQFGHRRKDLLSTVARDEPGGMGTPECIPPRENTWSV